MDDKVEDLSDSDLERLVEKLSRDVQEKQGRVQSLKIEILSMQDEIKQQQTERTGFANQLFQAEEVSPLLEQCVQLRQNLTKKSKDFEAISEGTSETCSEIKRLERQLCEIESGLHLNEMEQENKENAVSLEELKRLHQAKVTERKEIEEKLTQMHIRVKELQREQAERRTPPSSSTRGNVAAKLDRFIMKTCKQSGLQLH